MTDARRLSAWAAAALLLMMLAVLALLPGTARAESVKYLDANGLEQTANANLLNAEGAAEGDWWYVDGSLTVSEINITRGQYINLILKNGCSLEVSQGIDVRGGSLTIYGQQGGGGTLRATGSDGKAGIGVAESARLTINGGFVVASATKQAGNDDRCGAGIGGSGASQGDRNCGTVTVNGGRVTAISENAAGIGGAFTSNTTGKGGTVTVDGGLVIAKSRTTGAGIGAGRTRATGGHSGGTLSVSNAVIIAQSMAGIGIGGSAGGTVKAAKNAVLLASGLFGGIGAEIQEKSDCIVVANNKGELCGTVTLPGDVQIVPNDGNVDGSLFGQCELEIPTGAGLVIPSGRSFTVYESKVVNKGTVTVETGATLNLGTPGWGEFDNTQGLIVNEGGQVKGNPTGGMGTVKTYVTGVSLSPSDLSLAPGSTATLTATVSPGDATDKSLSWQSDCVRVATVDANGTVTAHAPGTALITVTTNDGGKTATCLVTVTSAAPQPEPATYTVTYLDGANGSVFKEEVHRGLSLGAKTPSFVAPSRSGYIFKGWSPNRAPTVTADVVYTATWEADLTVLNETKAALTTAQQEKEAAEQRQREAERKAADAQAKLDAADARVDELQASLKSAQEAEAKAKEDLQEAEARVQKAADALTKAEAAQRAAEDALRAAQASSGSGSGPSVDWGAVAEAERRAEEAQATADKALRDLDDALRAAEDSAASEQAALRTVEQREAELKAALEAAGAQGAGAARVPLSSVSVKKPRASAKRGRKVTVAWQAPRGIAGLKYQVRYRRAGSKKWTVKTVSKTSLTVGRLKAGKKYTFQVRGFRKSAGKRSYTDWETLTARARK